MVYARVSSAGQQPDLANQVAALHAYCAEHGYQPDEWMEEIASGLNYQRTRFNHLMEQIEPGAGTAAHQRSQGPARPLRLRVVCGVLCPPRHGAELLIVNGDTLSPEQELVQDLLSSVQVFSARLHGLRSSKQVIRD